MMNDKLEEATLSSFITQRSSFITSMAAVLALIVPVAVFAQARTFAADGFEFTLELPSPTWRWVVEPVGPHKRVEFINGDDRMNGWLSVRKILLDSDASPEDLFKRERREKLQFLPGFVVCDDGRALELVARTFRHSRIPHLPPRECEEGSDGSVDVSGARRTRRPPAGRRRGPLLRHSQGAAADAGPVN
jgi:hypothetical protein